jgi:hypothetical protein
MHTRQSHDIYGRALLVTSELHARLRGRQLGDAYALYHYALYESPECHQRDHWLFRHYDRRVDAAVDDYRRRAST